MDKQIEEMLRTIVDKCDKCKRGCDLCEYRTDEIDKQHCAICRRSCNVEALYNASYRKIPENADWLDGYKQGFKEGVQAVQIQLKEKARPTYVNIDENPRKDSFLLLSDVDEICKELEGEK